jgi:protein transport protein SEC61 subunit alpha
MCIDQIITTIGAIGFVLAGFYGSIAEIGITNAALIVLQLVFAGVLVIMLDEMLQKGYGFGSAVSLFTACNVCQAFVLAAVSPLTIDRGNGKEFYGKLAC